jgi:hypothetical protein
LVASPEALIGRAEGISRTTGKSRDEAAAVVIGDLEAAATALTTRMAPLVPGCGVLVAISGLAVKAEPAKNTLSETFISLALLLAIGAFGFVTRALFLYAGRRTVGLSATVDDIPFARGRLVRKQTNAYRGSVLAAISLASLVFGILVGVHISLK